MPYSGQWRLSESRTVGVLKHDKIADLLKLTWKKAYIFWEKSDNFKNSET